MNYKILIFPLLVSVLVFACYSIITGITISNGVSVFNIMLGLGIMMGVLAVCAIFNKEIEQLPLIKLPQQHFSNVKVNEN